MSVLLVTLSWDCRLCQTELTLHMSVAVNLKVHGHTHIRSKVIVDIIQER